MRAIPQDMLAGDRESRFFRHSQRNMNADQDPLNQLLNGWSDAPLEHPRLRQRVWSRIVNEEEPAPALPSFFQLAHSLLSRPAYAAAFVVGCVLFGLLLAEVRVANQHARRGEQLAESYKQVIDPLLKNTSLTR